SDGGVGIDIGCGSGRWSMMIAPRVAHLHLLDVSPDALVVAKENLSGARNVSFHLASVNEIPLAPQSLDFAVALGVLHHVPDTQAAINKIAGKLKPGAPFMVYLYYAFDNRPSWYRMLWKASDRLRILVAQLPHPLRFVLSQLIALFVYWPLARLSKLADKLGFPVRSMPLSWYRDKSFYVMRTDAYDRFCTSLEKRFTREQIAAMFAQAGFRDIRFSESEPYWCAVGFKG
ncbi:MAG: class I SAM-dependent methyltransferase, partial [Xanthobacteraceae bacterium]